MKPNRVILFALMILLALSTLAVASQDAAAPKADPKAACCDGAKADCCKDGKCAETKCCEGGECKGGECCKDAKCCGGEAKAEKGKCCGGNMCDRKAHGEHKS